MPKAGNIRRILKPASVDQKAELRKEVEKIIERTEEENKALEKILRVNVNNKSDKK